MGLVSVRVGDARTRTHRGNNRVEYTDVSELYPLVGLILLSLQDALVPCYSPCFKVCNLKCASLAPLWVKILLLL